MHILNVYAHSLAFMKQRKKYLWTFGPKAYWNLTEWILWMTAAISGSAAYGSCWLSTEDPKAVIATQVSEQEEQVKAVLAVTQLLRVERSILPDTWVGNAYNKSSDAAKKKQQHRLLHLNYVFHLWKMGWLEKKKKLGKATVTGNLTAEPLLFTHSSGKFLDQLMSGLDIF